jgi:hypothetical protein
MIKHIISYRCYSKDLVPPTTWFTFNNKYSNDKSDSQNLITQH